LLYPSLREPASERDVTGLGGTLAVLAGLVTQRRILLLCGAHVTLLLSFVAMYSALGPHLAAIGSDPSRVIMLQVVGLPGMFAALAVGVLASRIGIPAVARSGYLLAAAGLVVEAGMAHSLSGLIVGIVVFVTGVALTVPSV